MRKPYNFELATRIRNPNYPRHNISENVVSIENYCRIRKFLVEDMEIHPFQTRYFLNRVIKDEMSDEQISE